MTKFLTGTSVINGSNWGANSDALAAVRAEMGMKTVFSVSGVLAEDLDKNCGVDLVGKKILFPLWGRSVGAIAKGNTWRDLWKTFEEAYHAAPGGDHIFFEGVFMPKNAALEFFAGS